MKNFSGVLFYNTQPESAKALPNQLQIIIVKHAFVIGGFVLVMAYYDAVSNDNEDASSVVGPMLQSSFASDHFRNTGY